MKFQIFIIILFILVFAGRFLVATGRPYVKHPEDYPNWANSSAGAKVEILDLSDPTKKCALLKDLYPPRSISAGGLLAGHPVICGGLNEYDVNGPGLFDCIVFGQYGNNRKLLMKQNRIGLAAVPINSSLLWLLGPDDSTEFISLNEGQSMLGPRIPFNIGGSCVVKYDDTRIYIIGTLHI